MSRIKWFILLFLVTSLLPNPHNAFAEQPHRRVAILPFSFHNASDETGDIDIGAEIAKVLSMKLSKIDGWAPVDHEDVAALLHKDGSANLSGAQIGRLLGADAIVIGTVQTFRFAPNDFSAKAALSNAVPVAAGLGRSAAAAVPGAGSLAGLTGLLNSVGPSGPSSAHGHAKVIVDAKLIDSHTGKTMAVLNGTASSHKSITSLWGNGGPNYDFLSTSFENSAVGKTTFAAVDEICTQLIAVQPQMDTLASHRCLGTITDVDDDLISVNIGSTNGYKVGDKFIVERDSSKPQNDSELRVGIIILTDVGKQASLARLVNGSKLVLAGDSICLEANDANQDVNSLHRSGAHHEK